MADVAHRPRDEINAQHDEAEVEERHHPVHNLMDLIKF